jgi:hypothetical protein
MDISTALSRERGSRGFGPRVSKVKLLELGEVPHPVRIYKPRRGLNDISVLSQPNMAVNLHGG